ncbi:MAG: hypothetical protein IKB70_13105 [Bacilli bacterium]|nr:hypothetical protein [Bacilli bacterium]
MKKFFSCFLAGLICVFSGLSVVLAGGVNKTEVLSDGTTLEYISTDKIPEVLEKYGKLSNEIIDQRFSTGQNLGVRLLSGTVAAVGYTLSSVVFSDSCLVLGGKIVSLIAGAVGFFYPDYRDWKLGEQFGGRYSNNGKSYAWGPQYEYHRIGAICNSLMEINNGLKNHNSSSYNTSVESGIVIVVRPKSKTKDAKAFRSGIYYQDEFGVTDQEGFRKGLINSCIPNGR